MEKSESIKNIIPAIIEVMKAVKNIDKNMIVGTGKNTYKGVADKDVKKDIGEAMEKNGLCIIPINIEEETQIDRWEETFDGNAKTKQNVFTKVKVTYLLSHVSGEYMTLVGYGHGVDSQDKGAGKATTYALKNALLYSFMVPTGSLDDTDKIHSDNIPIVPKDTRIQLIPEMETTWGNVVNALASGKFTIADIEKKYKISNEHKKLLLV
jgi:hypothetical protein